MSSIGSGALQSWQLLLTNAIKTGEEANVRDLLREGAAEHFSDRNDAATHLSKALLQAVGSRYAESLTKILLEAGADANSVSETGVPALHRAAWLGKDRVVRLLLDHDAKLESRNRRDGHTAIFEAAQKYHVRTFNLLVEVGADVNAKDLQGQNLLLHLASKKPESNEKQVQLRNDTVQAILDVRTLDLEAKEKDTSRTPLLCAAAIGNNGLIRALLSRSNGPAASLNAVNNRGKGVLHLAIEGNRISTVKLLLDLHADPQAKSDGNWTPLLMAAEKNRLEIASALLARNIDVNATTSSGMSALHWAARNGHIHMVQLLLDQKGIKRFTKDSFDVTPMLAAADQGHLDIATLLSPSNNGPQLSPLAKGACDGFRAEIVDFGMEKRPMNRHEHSVYDLLYGWNHKDNKPLITTLTRNVPAKPKFRWIHLPSNNMSWVEALINKYFIENSARDVDGFKLLEKSFSQVHRGTTVHSHFMRPMCQRFEATGKDPRNPTTSESMEEKAVQPLPTVTVDKVADKENEEQTTPNKKQKVKKGERPNQDARSNSTPKPSTHRKPKISEGNKSSSSLVTSPKAKFRPGNIILFMPYLHYETHEKRKFMSETIQKAMERMHHKNRRQSGVYSCDQMLIHGYLQSSHNLQIRRTLDQFYYHAIDTSDRDEDQVVWRYTGNKNMVQKLFMVDQLWLWILGDDLIITSFPQRWEQPKHDPLNMLNGIIEDTNSKTRPPVKSIYDLAMLIAGRCIGVFDRHSVFDPEYQFLDMFESSLGEVVDTETTLFRKFNLASTAAARLLQDRHQRRKAQRNKAIKAQGMEHQPGFVDTLLDISDETALLAETKDIKDELSMITMVLEYQEAILGDFERALLEELKGKANQDQHNEVRKRKKELERIISTQLKDIERMQRQGTSLYNSLTHLLDLKQKHANAIEARFARDQAVFAGRQGQTIMVFTIVTVIFLPMSFIASIFAIPLTAFANGQGNPSVKLANASSYIFGLGLAISLPLIAVAFAVDSISSTLTSLKRKLFRGDDSTGQEEALARSLSEESSTATVERTLPAKQSLGTDEGSPVSYHEKGGFRHRTVRSWRDSGVAKRSNGNAGDLERGP